MRPQLSKPLRVLSYPRLVPTARSRWNWAWHCRTCQGTGYGHDSMPAAYAAALGHRGECAAAPVWR